MLTAMKNRWRRFKGLVAFGWFLGSFYGDSLKNYPFKVGAKMMLARLAFVVPIPFLLPDKHYLIYHQGSRMYRQLNSCPIFWDLALGTYEYWKTRLISDLAKDGMTVLDIGANEGYYSMLSAKAMHDKGRVLAFEPDPDNARWLRKNIEVNGYQCIQVHEYALSDNEGEVTFYPAGGVGSLVHTDSPLAYFHGPSEAITVRTRTLDNVLLEAGITNVDLIKIDVEGADLLVLRGARRTLESSNVKILMDVDVHGRERQEVFDLLRSCGFSLYRVGRELELIHPAHPPGPAPVAAGGFVSGDGHPVSGPKTLKRLLARLLPAGIRTFVSCPLAVLLRYLTIPVSWFKAPRETREIYAVKRDPVREP
ncbi:MAG: FkbM family methyltransferase [Dehalococcoidia bacterium]|nr:FkbM family methyltransferase [Dehalococcoidia bacterium]